MSVKLLTEHHLEYLSLKGDCRGSFESTLCQNVKLLEISCHGSIILYSPLFLLKNVLYSYDAISLRPLSYCNSFL